jgi:hypothetical protein
MVLGWRARVPVRICWQPGRGHWLLARRNRTTGEVAHYVCFGPRKTRLMDLARIAGTRWAVESASTRPKARLGPRGPPPLSVSGTGAGAVGERDFGAVLDDARADEDAPGLARCRGAGPASQQPSSTPRRAKSVDRCRSHPDVGSRSASRTLGGRDVVVSAADFSVPEVRPWQLSPGPWWPSSTAA